MQNISIFEPVLTENKSKPRTDRKTYRKILRIVRPTRKRVCYRSNDMLDQQFSSDHKFISPPLAENKADTCQDNDGFKSQDLGLRYDQYEGYCRDDV